MVNGSGMYKLILNLVVNSYLWVNLIAMKKSLLLLVGIIIIVTASINCKNNDLHNSKISGVIQKCSYSIGKRGNRKHYTTISINNTEYKVTVVPAAGSEFTFLDVARVGDTVFKASNNDTLFLTRAGSNGDPLFPFIVKTYNDN